MNFKAKALYIKFSPFKLRPIVDVVRGKNLVQAINWLSIHKVKKAEPIKKLMLSAAANAKSLHNISPDQLFIRLFKVDHGPTLNYFKPSAMGRASVQKKRSSHLFLELAVINKEV